MAKREYSTDAITVHWDSSRCIHTGICLRTLPDVFDTSASPWVDVDAATTDEIAAAVARCPSGALQYERHDGQPGETPPEPPIVVARPRGPLSIHGTIELRGPDGAATPVGPRATLCRCGHSANQPFCDNSHKEHPPSK